MEGETPACDVDRSWPYLRSYFFPHTRPVDALDRGSLSNGRRVQREFHPLRYSEALYSTTTPVDLAPIPETYGFIAADRARRRPRRIGHLTRAEFPGSTGELRPRCWSAHPSPVGDYPTSPPHCSIQNSNQGVFDTKFFFRCFDGESHDEDYLDWEKYVEDFFYYADVPSEKQVRFVVRKLKGRASVWWTLMVQARHLEGRSEVKSWHKTKSLLRCQFLTSDCEHDKGIQENLVNNRNKLVEEKHELFLERSGGDEVEKAEDNSSNNDSSNSVYISIEQKKPKLEEQKFKETFILDMDEGNFDEKWEHEELIMQLKIKLKKVRAIDLPTILEESDSPKTIEDSKSFKIDENLVHEDPMEELQRLHKCYMEGMKKFDILNYQKMYASGFLQLGGPVELNKTQKPILSTIMSRLCQSFLSFGKKNSNCDPSEYYIKELRCELETVYVGQLCISWDFLRWQYEKLHKLTDSDSFICNQYNNVAAEFQKFIVTLQRFVENKIFQGPRVGNFVKQCCLLRNFLQLPVVKEDCLMDKMERGKEDVITGEKLGDIMEEIMRIVWEFVRAEKYKRVINYLQKLLTEWIYTLLSKIKEIEEVLEDLELPDDFHDRDILEKIELLSRFAIDHSSTVTELAEFF